MSTFQLIRFGQGSAGTIGWIFNPEGEFVCFTLERMWLDNKRNVSCIPEGTYALEPHIWHAGAANERATLALVGGTVDHWESTSHVGRRFAVLFHPANRVLELEGCIAPVSKLAYKGSLFGESSGDALDRLLVQLGPGDLLDITNSVGIGDGQQLGFVSTD